MSSILPPPTPNMTIDVVNEADEKIGEATRREVLPTAKNFHTAHLFLLDGNGRILLQQLSASRERHPLTWGASVAGYVFAGESYEHAIRRRALQELGVEIDPNLVGKIEMVDERSVKFVSLFWAVLRGDVRPDPEHIAAVRFATTSEISAELGQNPERFTPTFREIFPFYLRARS